MSKNKFIWENFYKSLALKIIEKFNKDQIGIEKYLRGIMTNGIKKGLLYIDMDSKISEYGNEYIKDRIDPFTFFANFNRKITFENKKLILQDLNTHFNLNYELPEEDYLVPIVNNLKSWFFSGDIKKGDLDIDNLWNLFIQGSSGNINRDLFNKVFKQKVIGIAKMTIGLFWINPDKYISLDKNTIGSIEDIYNIKVKDSEFNYDLYIELLENLKSRSETSDFIKLVADSYGKVGNTYITNDTDRFSNGFIELIKKYEKLPISILIKGEWGVGKTELFKNLSKDLDLRKEFKLIKVNTWEYSQNSRYKELVLKKIISEIGEKHFIINFINYIFNIQFCKEDYKSSPKIYKIISIIDSVTYLFGTKYIILFFYFIYNVVKKIQFNLGIVTLDLDSFSDSQINSIKSIIKKNINNSRQKYLIFIDDLDRITPEEAVNILDLLKNILIIDGVNIVFVVAADDNIVKIGLKSKYKKEDTEDLVSYSLFYNKYLNKIFDIYFYPFPANQEAIINIIKSEHSYLLNFFNDDLKILSDGLLRIGNNNFRNIKSILLKYRMLYEIISLEENIKDNFKDYIVHDIKSNSKEKIFEYYTIKTKELGILKHLNENSFDLDENSIEDVNLKFIFSGPAYLPQIFYIIKNKDKLWKNESRANSSPDILYSWAYDFVKILGLGKDYNNRTNTITLTDEGDKVYEIIQKLEDKLLYEYKPIIIESHIKEYEKLLENSLGENLILLKYLLKVSIEKTIGFKKIKKILDENKEGIDRNKLFEILSKDLDVSIGTLGNRVPSMLQLAIFVDLIEIDKNIIKTKKRD